MLSSDINLRHTGHWLLMALPQSLRALQEYLGLENLSDLLCTCMYCGRYLSYADKVLFDHSGLKIFWQDGAFFGSCYCCVRATARVEFMSFFDRVVTVQQAERREGVPFTQIKVRCLGCLRELNHVEKCDVICSDSDCFIVRGSIRTVCVVCRIGL
ncbi:putative E6 oncogenic protein [Eptesicus serotinus papillomavirus 1]|uniref:Protein E6 n=1 Tax=Eptesicus serotinus papillomavirus 1 TaxID=1464071 RepID=W8EFZ2_9PAPI|nr:putative E6 oncogenic protein [Eptesicus serotinus papillomavirus 1]AHJ81384.1 putative E6 oncogenic protein [Eptesicus serotinus papillomavirus 1]